MMVRQTVPAEDLIRRCKTQLWNAKVERIGFGSVNKGHYCHAGPGGCNPENETALVRRNRMMGNTCTGLTHIYLCDFGVMHVCTDIECELCIETGTCPISGMVHSVVFETGNDRSGHYRKAARREMTASAHSKTTHGLYEHDTREKRSLAKSDSALLSRKKRRRSKLLTSRNMFRQSGSSTVEVERQLRNPKQQKVSEGDVVGSHLVSQSNGEERTSPTAGRGPVRFFAVTDTRAEAPAIDLSVPDEENSDEERARTMGSSPLPQTLAPKKPGSRRGERVDGKRVITASMRDRFRTNVTALLNRLFYSTIRGDLNERARREGKEEWEKCYKKYCKDTASEGRHETFIEKYEIALNTQVEPPFVILEDDGKLVDKYFNIIRHVWGIITKYGSPSFCNAGDRVCVQLTLGVLYSMRNSGIVIDGYNFLPPNAELLVLPPLSLLHHFQPSTGTNASYGRRLTTGVNEIMAAYRAAIQSGATQISLMLSSNMTEAEQKIVDGEEVKEELIKVISRPAKQFTDNWIGHFTYLSYDDVYAQVIKDRPYRKNNSPDECLGHLLDLEEAAKREFNNVAAHFRKKYRDLTEIDIRLAIMETQAWRGYEERKKCGQRLRAQRGRK